MLRKGLQYMTIQTSNVQGNFQSSPKKMPISYEREGNIRKEFLPFHLPEIGEEEIQAVVEVLRSGWLTTGPKTKEFEQNFAAQVGSPYAVALNSCTAALHLALDAVGVREGDEVLVPTMTFAATGEVVTYLKAKPVLVDCRPDTLTLNVGQLERLITPKTKAIIPVHFAGHPCDMNRLMEIAHRYNLRIIEDAAHAFPASYQGKKIGSFGDITCFSFYATKTMTTGEGGMATTSNPEWADRMRMMSLHGISRDAWKRYTNEGSWSYEILLPGCKYNMTDMAAALGIQQLKKSQQFCEFRQDYARLYKEGLKDIPEIILPTEEAGIHHAWHLFVIQLDLARLRIQRNEFIEILKKYNIGSSVHFIPLHLHPYYRESYGYSPKDFPIASNVFNRIVSLPLYPKMTKANVLEVIEVVREIIKHYRR
jgi:perosamine synthetase